MPDIRSVPPQQLELYLQRLFKIGDKDGNGVLDSTEFRELLSKSGFNLDYATITKMMTAADTNKDGVIQFEEFVPAMRALIGDLTNDTAEPMPHLHSVPPIEMESYLRRLFQIGDRNNDGKLQPAEFEALLKKSGFGFDTGTIAHIMHIADTNQDGVIQYEEYIPAVIHIIIASPLAPPGGQAAGYHPYGLHHPAAYGQQYQTKIAPAQSFKGTGDVDPRGPKKEGMPAFKDVPPQQLELYMQRLFKIGDKDGNGVLDATEFRDLLRKSGFGLDTDTIDKIMAAADTNKDGVVQYEEFVPAMRALISNMDNMDNMPTEWGPVPVNQPNPALPHGHARAASQNSSQHPNAVPSPYYGADPSFAGHRGYGGYGGAYGQPGWGGYGHPGFGHPGASHGFGGPYAHGFGGPYAHGFGGPGPARGPHGGHHGGHQGGSSQQQPATAPSSERRGSASWAQ